MYKSCSFADVFRAYNIQKGLIFSISVGMVASLLKLIRLDATGLGEISRHMAFVTSNFFLCWVIHHFFLLHAGSKIFPNKYVKGAASIAAGMGSIFLVSGLLRTMNLQPVINVGKDLKDAHIFTAYTFRNLVISSFVYFVVYYFRMHISLQQSQLENEYLKQENLKAQIASLRQQISPHFLFNSLNTLSTLAADDAAKEYAVKLSDVYRYVLHYQEQNEVSVKNELQFIASYIYVLQTRFEEGLNIKLSVAADKLNQRIVPLALQLLIENAVKHNIISHNKPLSITIYDNGPGLVVENNYQPKNSVEKGSRIGLHNLSQRYKLYTGQDISIQKTGMVFSVSIPFLI